MKKSQKSVKGLRNSFQKMKGATKGAGLSLGAVAGIATGVTAAFKALKGAVGVVEDSLDRVDKAAKIASRINATAGDVQSLGLAAQLSGSDVGVLTKGLENLAVKLGDAAQGKSRATKVFQALGVDFREIAALSPTQQLQAVATAIQGLQNQSDKINITKMLFGDTRLLNLLDDTSTSLDSVKSRLADMCILLDATDASAIENLNDSIAETKGIFEGVADKLTAKLAPALSAVLDLFLEQPGAIKNTIDSAGNIQGVIKLVVDWATQLSMLKDAFNIVADSIKFVVNLGRTIFTGLIGLVSKGLEKIIRLGAFLSEKLGFEGVGKKLRVFQADLDVLSSANIQASNEFQKNAINDLKDIGTNTGDLFFGGDKKTRNKLLENVRKEQEAAQRKAAEKTRKLKKQQVKQQLELERKLRDAAQKEQLKKEQEKLKQLQIAAKKAAKIIERTNKQAAAKRTKPKDVVIKPQQFQRVDVGNLSLTGLAAVREQKQTLNERQLKETKKTNSILLNKLPKSLADQLAGISTTGFVTVLG